MHISDYDYELPSDLIAQTPAEPRDSARLLVVERATRRLSHHIFRDLPALLRPDDVLVVNDSRVLPARLYGRRAGTGGAVEALLLREEEPDVWQALVRPGRRIRTGDTLLFDGQPTGTAAVPAAGAPIVTADLQPDDVPTGTAGFQPANGPTVDPATPEAQDAQAPTVDAETAPPLTAVVLDRLAGGERLLRLHAETGTVREAIHRIGVAPLPPYIHAPLRDPERYQTVYARDEGSVAAPTAGLHFTTETLQRLRDRGIQTRRVTLHVGAGTFKPMAGDDIAAHVMHAEWAELDAETAAYLNRARAEGRRVIVVGTTSVRVLESAAATGELRPFAGWTDIFIRPGHTFNAVDGMITNFHLPRSTLLLLVSAFAGKGLIDEAYATAIARRYRFYSFGDAMLIV